MSISWESNVRKVIPYTPGEQPKNTDVINNIYDLYGCHYEWTLEACVSKIRARRGGYSGDSYSPPRRDNFYPDIAGSLNSSRATLYVK